MARQRVRAAQRKQRHELAHVIADGVYKLAKELDAGPRLDLPLPMQAPLQYTAEMLAFEAVEAEKIDQGQFDEAVLYFLSGLREMAVALRGEFDRERFEAWIAAERGEAVRLSSGGGSE